jgi:hypothetical protein
MTRAEGESKMPRFDLGQGTKENPWQQTIVVYLCGHEKVSPYCAPGEYATLRGTIRVDLPCLGCDVDTYWAIREGHIMIEAPR